MWRVPFPYLRLVSLPIPPRAGLSKPTPGSDISVREGLQSMRRQTVNKTLYIIHGAQGSGKSTLAHAVSGVVIDPVCALLDVTSVVNSMQVGVPNVAFVYTEWPKCISPDAVYAAAAVLGYRVFTITCNSVRGYDE